MGKPKRPTDEFTLKMYIPVYFFVSLMLLPLTLSLLSIFVILRSIVYIIVLLQYGSKFKGFMRSADAMWATDATIREATTIILMIDVENDKDCCKEMRNVWKYLVTREKYWKLTCRKLRKVGYYFWVKEDIDINEYVRPFDLGEKTLQEVVEEQSNAKFPKNDQGTWDLLVCTSYINYGKSNKKVCPVILRLHHTLGDGFSQFQICLESANKYVKVREEEKEVVPEKIFQKLLKTLAKTAKDIGMFFYGHIYYIFFAIAFEIHQAIIRSEDDFNSLHKPTNNDDKVLEWLLEDDEYSAFNALKRIKKKFGTSFSNTVLTAISAGLYEFTKKNATDQPEDITLSLIVSPVPLENRKQEATELKNNFTVILVDFPVFVKTGRNTDVSFKERLSVVKSRMDIFRYTPDIFANYLLMEMVIRLQPAFINALIHRLDSSLAISMMPGPSQMTMFKEDTIRDVIFWIPIRNNLGIGVSVLTYNDRLQLGIMASKAVVGDKERAREILKYIVHAIKEMDKS